jgi:molecular chaperone DnaK
VTRTEEYFTSYDYQTEVQLDIYQGDDPDAMRNVHLGQCRVEGLQPVAGPHIVLCRMRLDLDGILHVTAIEKRTGLSSEGKVWSRWRFGAPALPINPAKRALCAL